MDDHKSKHDGGGGGGRRNKDNLANDYDGRKEDRHSRREHRRDERRRRERSNDHHHRTDRRLSESPPASPRVTILKHSETAFSKSISNLSNNQYNSSSVNSSAVASGPSTPVHKIQSQQQQPSKPQQNQQNQHQQGQQGQQQQQLQLQGQQQNSSGLPTVQNPEDVMNEMIENMPSIMKLIDTESWSFFEHPAADYLFGETHSSGVGGLTVISAVGTQSVGKSSLLNRIAGANVFKTHQSPGNADSLLKHVTRGIDLHVTRERLLLLDSQPLVSASLLDDYIKNGPSSTNILSDASEPETYVYMTSLQLLSFLLAVSDYVIVVNDWIMDIHLIKLLATAIMMVGNETHQAELIFQFPQTKDPNQKKSISRTLRSLLGGEYSNIKEIVDENEPLPKLIKLLSRRVVLEGERGSAHTCEKSWLASAQRFWENSIRKSTLFSDYARLTL